MPLDFTSQLDMPDYLQFTTHKEPTRMEGKDYVVNDETGEVLGIVGSKFNAVSHQEFYHNVYNTMSEQLGEDAMQGVQIKWNTARNGAFRYARCHNAKHQGYHNDSQTKDRGITKSDSTAWCGRSVF